MNADERSTLAGWLDFYRATLIGKCDGLDEAQARIASVEPSALTLLGLVQHIAEVERNWFRRVLTGEDVGPIHDSPSATAGHDGGFDLAEGATLDGALAAWRREVEVARRHCADRDLDRTSPLGDGEITLRWIYAHMIGEYARHTGHADLIRERIDGSTGV
jgi:uncharacterized damage-inducible protein DinB